MDRGSSLERLGSAWIAIIKDQAKLFALESELAQLSCFPLLLSGLALALFTMSLWALILISVYYGMYLYTQNTTWSLLTVIGLNLILMILAFVSIRKHQARMQFKHSRAALKELLR